VPVVALTAAECIGLRRRVLRAGTPSSDASFDEDGEATTFHIGWRDDAGEVIAVATFVARPCPGRPDHRGVQLRGMAVDPASQGTGLGRLLMLAAVEQLRGEGVAVLWAKARDTAVGFYERLGMHAEGDGYVTPDTGLPHHTVILDL
jgi:GNAT superfamily N-acetyltransferase